MTSEGATDTQPETPKSIFEDPRFIRKMLIVVAIMSAILVIGFFVIMGRIFYLASRTNTPTTSSAAVISTSSQLTLPAGAKITSMSLSGNRLAVHFTAPTGSGIHIINTDTGTVENRIDIPPTVPTQ